jgi:formate-dependent nitrite reductase cytochrome c552 subunit
MDVSALQLLVTGLGAAGAKPVWDYLSGRTAAKKSSEDRLWAEIADLKKVITNTNVRLDKAKTHIAELEMKAVRDQNNWERQIAEVTDLMSDLQANNDAITADLKITAEHVAALQDQLKALDQVPAPRPEQPRNPNGTFASPSNAPVARKGKK